MDIAGDDRADAGVLGEIAQERVPVCVAPLERALQLDVEALRPEGAGECRGSVRVAHAESVAGAPREADQPFVQLGEQRRIERRRQQLASFLRPRVRVRGGQQPAEVRVALRRLDEERHVRATVQGHLGAGDRADAEVLRRVCELERAEDALVVRERERLVAELRRPQGELLRVRCPVQE